MTNETKCVIAEQVLEGLMGGAIGIALTKFVLPKCNVTEKVVVTLGTCVGSWVLGRELGKKFYKWCDDNVEDVDFEDVINDL